MPRDLRIVAVLFLAILALFPCRAQDNGQLTLSTVVIDPGHGGKDPGCLSRDRKIFEKNFALDISKRLASMIREAYPDIKVICTRTTDRYLTLNERAEIANRNRANLFISIHINAVDSPSPKGYSTHILGQSSKKDTDLFSFNMDVCRRENSVILLEEDYSTKYQGFDPNDPESFIFFNLMQNANYEQSLMFAAEVNKQMGKGPLDTDRGIFQDPFYVLWKTTMPSVLVEAGFLSNPSDLKVLTSDTGTENIAKTLFYAFRNFKASYDKSLNINGKDGNDTGSGKTADSTASGSSTSSSSSSATKTFPASSTSSSSSSATKTSPVSSSTVGTPTSYVRYGVQVMAVSKVVPPGDRCFRNYNVTSYKVGNLYKYILEESENEHMVVEKFSEIKKIFPDSFIVKIEGEKISFYKR